MRCRLRRVKKPLHTNTFHRSLALGTFVVFACLMFMTSYFNYRASLQGYEHGLYSHAKMSVEACTSKLEFYGRQLVNASRSPSLGRLAASIRAGSQPDWQRAALEKEAALDLHHSVAQSPYFLSVGMQDMRGRFYFEDGERPGSVQAMRMQENELRWQPGSQEYKVRFASNGSAAYIVVSTPVYTQDGAQGGVLHMLLDKGLLRVRAEPFPDKTAYVVCLDIKTGLPLYTDQYTSYEQGLRIYTDNPELRRSMLSNMEREDNHFPYTAADGTRMVGAVSGSSRFGLAVLCSMSLREMLREVRVYALLQAGGTFFLLFLLALAMYFLYNRMDRPVSELVERCRRIASGDSSVRFPEQQDKDLNVLSQTLNDYRDKMERAAYTDPVVGIGNRIRYYRDIDYRISVPGCRHFSLFLVDIAGFGRFNSLFSAHAGDELLRRVARRLSAMFEDKVYRVSGDVFICASKEGRDGLEEATRLQAMLTDVFPVMGTEYVLDYHAGVCQYPEHGTTAETLLDKVQIVVKYAKLRDERIVAYNDAIEAYMKRDEHICGLIRRRIADHSLDVWYQPIYNVHTGLFTSAEALLRLRDDNGVPISPLDAVKIAEKNGLVEEIGNYVLERTCRLLGKLYGQGSAVENIHVNFSVIQFMQPGFARQVENVINRYQIPAALVGMEITETVLIESFTQVIETLRQLHEMGVRLALDDFGSGYSSLNYLSRLPMDHLKLDRALVLLARESGKQFDFVKTIISLAKIQGQLVIAEGVEDAEMAQTIRRCGCDYIQGYYYAKPMPEDEYLRLALSQTPAILPTANRTEAAAV